MNNLERIVISSMGFAVLVHGQIQDLKHPNNQDHPSDFGGTYIMKNINNSSSVISALTISVVPPIIGLNL